MTTVDQIVNHWQHGMGTITEVFEDGFVRVQFESSARIISESNLTGQDGAPLVVPVVRQPVYSTTRVATRRAQQKRASLRLSEEKQLRLVEIFKNDPVFSMPISSPPDQEDQTIDEVDHAEDGMTVASSRKQFVSYDTVFSTSDEVESLLVDSGAYAAPYFDSEKISLLHGCRKDFYMMLIKHGLAPSLLSNSTKE